jgi:pimeloyl-ACP methyl ester carboxylesterase
MSVPYRLAVFVLILLGAGLTFPHRSPAAGTQLGSSPELRWSACHDVPHVECAGLEVPVDPARPDAAQFTIRLGRVPATDPARKKGVLLFIPGGPGVGISGVFGQLGGLQHIDDFARQYDVVSFDPRGIGQSSPIRCDPDAVPPASEPIYRPPTPAEFEALARANAVFFRSCFAATGELMAHLSARATAADIERIRQALSPNDGLVAYAGSYGTIYGAAYLERYGDRVKTLVLDAVVDHSIDLSTMVVRNILSVADAFDRFARWCSRDSTCARHGQDLGNVFDAVGATAPVTRTLVPQLLAAGRDPQLGWPAIARMLAQASRGDTSALDKLAEAASLGSTAADPWVAAGWPSEASNPPHRLQVGSHPNVMVANGTHDPATPLINALSVWLQIPDARLLIADVDGHQTLAWSRCAFEGQLHFLLDPTSVSATTLCPD